MYKGLDSSSQVISFRLTWTGYQYLSSHGKYDRRRTPAHVGSSTAVSADFGYQGIEEVYDAIGKPGISRNDRF